VVPLTPTDSIELVEWRVNFTRSEYPWRNIETVIRLFRQAQPQRYLYILAALEGKRTNQGQRRRIKQNMNLKTRSAITTLTTHPLMKRAGWMLCTSTRGNAVHRGLGWTMMRAKNDPSHITNWRLLMTSQLTDIGTCDYVNSDSDITTIVLDITTRVLLSFPPCLLFLETYRRCYRLMCRRKLFPLLWAHDIRRENNCQRLNWHSIRISLIGYSLFTQTSIVWPHCDDNID